MSGKVFIAPPRGDTGWRGVGLQILDVNDPLGRLRRPDAVPSDQELG